MKLSTLLYLSLFVFLFACGGSEESSEKNKPAYYIELGDEITGTSKDNDISYISDGITDETEWKIEDSKIMLWGFDSQKDQGIMTLEGMSFDAEIIMSETISGTATIESVVETGEKPNFIDYDVAGTFEGENGEKGGFRVSTFEITD